MNISHWLKTAPTFSTGPLELPAHADIVILGAGIMGCSLAYWLTRYGQRPLVIERNAHPAGGATGRNGGLVVAGPSKPYHVATQRLGQAAAREIMQATLLNRDLLEEVLARESIAAHYGRAGFMAIGGSEEEVEGLKVMVHELNADGFAAEWLERPQAERQLGTELGSKYVGAAFSPGDGQIHSTRYAFGVAQGARRAGAQLAFSTSVQVIEPGPGGRDWRIRASRGEITAGQVVIALNAWAGDLFPEVRGFIAPTRGHIILTAPVGFSLTPWVANEGWDYGRQLETGQLLIGGRRISRPDRDLGHAPPPGENVPPVAPEVISALSHIAPQLFPALADVPIVQQWTGTMGFTPDEQPLVGRWPGREGLWLMAGFSGHGMPFSQVLPCTLAARLAGADGPTIPGAFDPLRFLKEESQAS